MSLSPQGNPLSVIERQTKSAHWYYGSYHGSIVQRVGILYRKRADQLPGVMTESGVRSGAKASQKEQQQKKGRWKTES